MSDEKFIEVAERAESMAQAAKELGMTFNTFKRKAIRLGVYNTNQSGRGLTRDGSNRRKYLLEEILVENSPYPRTYIIKRWLLQEGILEEKCAECGIGNQWNGEFLALHLDHINGVSNDNRLENLRILCPNCHSQTDTYCGKNLRKKDGASL